MAAFMGVILSWGGPPRGRTTATRPLCVRGVVVCRGGRVEPEMPATGGRGGLPREEHLHDDLEGCAADLHDSATDDEAPTGGLGQHREQCLHELGVLPER